MRNYPFQYKIICSFLLLWGVVSLLAQGSDNPFELKHRQNLEVLDTSQQSINSNNTLDKPTNPFDIVTKTKKRTNTPKTVNKPKAQEKTTNTSHLGFLFWVLLTVLLVFTSIFGISRERINKMYNSFLNENFMRQTHRMNQGNFSINYLILYVFAFVNLGIFIFLSLHFFDINTSFTFIFLLQLIGIITVILLAKHLILSIVGNIFPVKKEMSLYSYMVMVFWSLIGIFLLPINIAIAYAPPIVGRMAIYGAIGAIIAIYLFRAIRGISIGSKYLMSNTFHFFIYLCTVEILPVVVLLKIIQNNTNGIIF